ICTCFGLISLAIGSVVYQLCCPTEIKDHKTATDYIAAARSNMGDVMLGRMESNLRQNSISSEEFLHMQSMAQDRAMAGGLNPKIEADKIYYQYFTDVMDLHFRTLNQSQPFARVSTCIFYATGFIVLSVL